jgi:hypothetical protein
LIFVIVSEGETAKDIAQNALPVKADGGAVRMDIGFERVRA